MSKAVWYVVYM